VSASTSHAALNALPPAAATNAQDDNKGDDKDDDDGEEETETRGHETDQWEAILSRDIPPVAKLKVLGSAQRHDAFFSKDGDDNPMMRALVQQKDQQKILVRPEAFYALEFTGDTIEKLVLNRGHRKQPTHLTCIVGLKELYAPIFFYLSIRVAIFAKVVSMALLLPSTSTEGRCVYDLCYCLHQLSTFTAISPNAALYRTSSKLLMGWAVTQRRCDGATSMRA